MSGEETIPFWGAREIPEGGEGIWKVGPLHLRAQRRAHEWRVSRHLDSEEELRSEFQCQDAYSDEGMENLTRFGVAATGSSFSLQPRLADRAVVSVPESPFQVPAGQEVQLYVGSPLWIRLFAGEILLEETAIVPPAETWLGPNTQTGEICYASRTSCRLERKNFPQRPHRSASLVRVRNMSSESLLLERLKLPAPHLSLFAPDNSNELWTNDIVVEYEGHLDRAHISIDKNAPSAVPDAKLVEGPRERSSGGLVVRAFGNLLPDRFGGAGA